MRRALLAAVMVGALFVAVTQALATGVRPTVAEDDFYDSDGQVDEGFEGVLVNNGSNIHTVTADAAGPDGKALFRTGDVSGGEMGPIAGTNFLSQGSYDFHCTIHPEMQGTLPVSDGFGTDPDPRPEISLKVKSKKLEKVVDTEKLKVTVRSQGPTDAENVSLKARKGKKKVAKDNLDVGGGKGETAKLKLTKKGENVLEDLDKAKVKVEGTVEFGFGDKAKKKLK